MTNALDVDMPQPGQAGPSDALWRMAPEAVRLERLDDTCNKLRHLFERWDNRLVFDEKLSLCERYVEGRLEFLCHLEILTDGKAHDFCVTIKKIDPTISQRDQFGVVYDDPKVGDTSKTSNGNDKLVFVRDVEIVDAPQHVIPSLIGFKRPDYIDNIWGGAVYLFLFDHSLKTVP